MHTLGQNFQVTTEADLAISRFRLQHGSGKKESTPDALVGNDPDSFVGLRTIEEQIHILRKFFPELGPANHRLCTLIATDKMALPGRGTDWFATFHWSLVGSTFPEALSRVYSLLYGIHGDRFMDTLGLSNLTEGQDKVRSIGSLRRAQGADILIFPAQFGHLYDSMSVKGAHEVMQKEEFGLGIFDVSLMLLVHSERLQYLTRRGIYCGGDVCVSIEDKTEHVPCLRLKGQVDMEITHVSVHEHEEHFGAASGWVITHGLSHSWKPKFPKGVRRHAFFHLVPWCFWH